MDFNDLEKRISDIEKRNSKVELDKKWETSSMRRVLLILFTFLSIAIYMKYIQIEKPFLNAVVPTLGFFLSTLSLPIFRNIWEKFTTNKSSNP